MFSEQKLSQSGQETTKYWCKNLFTQTNITILNTKNCISKLSTAMFIKRETNGGKVHAYQKLLSFKMLVTYKESLNYISDNSVLCEAAFVGYNSIFCGTLSDIRC